jgi:hypothetical protein
MTRLRLKLLLGGCVSTVISLTNGGYVRRFFAVLLAVFFTSLSLVSLVTGVQAQAPSLGLPRNMAMIVSHEPLTVTVSLKSGHESLTPTLMTGDVPTLPMRLKLIGSMFGFGTADTPKARPMIIKVHYTPSDALEEERLTLAYYDTLADKWLPLDTTIDAVNHVATAETTQPTALYALVVSPAVASLPPSAVIVDDLDTAHFARYGALAGWHDVSGATDHYYLGHMYWTSNTYSTLDNYAIWTPALSPDSYRVYAFIDWDNATTMPNGLIWGHIALTAYRAAITCASMMSRANRP